MVMKANQIKPSALLATVVLGDVSPLVTEEGRSVYEYLNGERTEKVKGYATELVLTNQNFEKVRCETPNMPRIFMGGKITEPVQVELVTQLQKLRIRIMSKSMLMTSFYQIQMRWYYDGKNEKWFT